jgi:hypothetical protein
MAVIRPTRRISAQFSTLVGNSKIPEPKIVPMCSTACYSAVGAHPSIALAVTQFKSGLVLVYGANSHRASKSVVTG